MGASLPTQVLEREHRFIEKVVQACLALSEEIRAGRAIDADLLRRIADFMRVYADKCHHGKEEILLFPALIARGVPMTGCPIGALSAEHVQGRRLVGGLVDSVGMLDSAGEEARKGILANLDGIQRLYPNHIWKEDYLLFPMTLKMMDPKDLEALQEKFEAVDRSLGREALLGYETFADGLEARSKNPA
ncbi:MAG: hemerythrin domain-containing protein [Anaerolineales bacterium]|nr:hemerythrin domain-containing protein [Anaerolineales bacterium]